MLVNIVVPGYQKTLQFDINAENPLQSYSWVDIVSANIIADTSKHVKIVKVEYETETLHHGRSMIHQNISENAILYIHVEVNDMNEMMNAHSYAISEMNMSSKME